MNILIPMAGGGTRFSQNGYKDSKPLIDVNGLPMIVRVLDNLGDIGKYVFVVREDAPDYHRLVSLLWSLKPGCKIITTRHLTRGAAETCLLAKDYIQDDSLLIANCDQIEDWTPQQFMNCVSVSTADGIMVTYHSNDVKNSYAEIDVNDPLKYRVSRVAEKEVISNCATTGLYYWRKGSDFVSDASNMIRKNIRTNNEFYVCPVYNETISRGGLVEIYPIFQHHPIGTPEDLQKYLSRSTIK